MPRDKAVVAAFDFDGTISMRDTFFPFLVYAFGKAAVYSALALGLMELLQWHPDKSVRDRLKASFVRRLFKSVSRRELEAAAEAYAQQVLAKHLRRKALERIRWHREQGHRCVMVSASPDIYLKYIVQALGFSDLLCTQLGVDAEIFTGELVGANCRCAEKVRRLARLLGNLEQYCIYAYGDSAGDEEMLAIATEKYFKPFRGI